MYAAHGLLLRASIVLGMVAAVVTILYLTPMPDQYFLSCDRPCHDQDWPMSPMICRVKLIIEYQTIKKPPCDSDNCTIEGTALSIYSVNKELPGPSIQICQNDILVVDVVNKIPGHSVTIHWRGQPQHEAPAMDGVPMVTQCPISSYTTFQYRFRASSPGTHLWHAHAGSEVADGIFGALIVRQPQKLEPHRKFYDTDDKNHVIIISEWGAELSSNLIDEVPRSLLINGKGASDQSVFKVRAGKRYRFRTAYSGGPIGCPVTLSVDQHLLKVIALDGNPITPYEVSSVTLSKGERLDFVLKANQASDRYVLKVASECDGGPIEGRALVKYDGVSGERKLAESKRRVDLVNTALSGNTRKFDTSFCESKLGQVCISDVHSLAKIPQKLATEDVDQRIYFGFDYKVLGQTSDSNPKEYRNKVYRMNNKTFTYPSSPLLTQREDISPNNICSSVYKPKHCYESEICECVHVEEIPLDATVELILADLGGDSEETVFHLHGYSFYVVGYKNFNEVVSLEKLRRLDAEGHLMKRNFNTPVIKDTIRVPKFGVIAVRFIATNPGYWMLRDEHSKQWSRGLDVVLQVGDSCDMVAKPSNFPTCGSWIGPDFFLA